MRLAVCCSQPAPHSVREPQVDNHCRSELVCGILVEFDVVYDEMHWKNYVLLGTGIRLRIFTSLF